MISIAAGVLILLFIVVGATMFVVDCDFTEALAIVGTIVLGIVAVVVVLLLTVFAIGLIISGCTGQSI